MNKKKNKNKNKKIIIIMAVSTLVINPKKYPITHTTDDLTNKEYKNNIITTTNSVIDIATEKFNNFVDAYNSQNDMIFEVENTLLIRHFFLETLDEINKELKKNNKDFRINIGPQLLSAFKERDEQYIKDYDICNLDGTIDNNKLQTHLQYTEKFITSFSNSKKLYIKPIYVDDNLLSVFL